MLLTWDAPAEDAESVTGYRIKRRAPGKGQQYLRVLVADTGSTETIYLDTTTKNGVRYVYRVLALRGEVVSAVSNFAERKYRSPATTTPTLTGILVDNSGAVNSFETHQMGEVSAQGFTTGSTPYSLTGVEMTIYFFEEITQDLSFSISEATSAGQPGESIYDLQFDIPDRQTLVTLFLAAPDEATLEPNTEYFVHIDGGVVVLYKTTSKTEDATGLSDWSIADKHWSYDGTSWTSSNSHVYQITVRGEEVVRPDAEGDDPHTAVRLPYTRFAGESPFVRAFLNHSTDVDWFNTRSDYDSRARYRIDIDPVALTNDYDIRLSALYPEDGYYRPTEEILELEELTDPPEGLISYWVTVPRDAGPYIKVRADNGAIGEYRIRIVYDPVRTWNGKEFFGDLPHDDTTWATATLGVSQTGVYDYYDDHDWFAVELEEDETYVVLTVPPPNSRVTTPDIGTVVRLYDSAGDQLEIDYANSRLSNALISYTVPTGEGGTFYVDVSYANFLDDPDALAALGLTEGIETGSSPFIKSRYLFTVSQQ